MDSGQGGSKISKGEAPRHRGEGIQKHEKSPLLGDMLGDALENSLESHNEADDALVATLSSLPPLERIRLTFLEKIAISCGHFQNDLCAALWFSYLILYFQDVVGFHSGPETYAASLMLIGQIVDGVSTPLVGYEVDHFNICPKNYGRCKSWHLWGSIMVIASFPFIFSPVIGGSSNTADWVKMLYYSPFIVIFQIGWASVQVSHLAIIPKMHPDELVRTELFSIRYAFTVVANLTIFVMTWVQLSVQERSDGAHKKCTVNQDDANTFMVISLIAVGIGAISTVFFHFGVKEEPDLVVKEKVASINSRTDIIRQLNRASETKNTPGMAGRRHSTFSKDSSSEERPPQGGDADSRKVLIDERSMEERQERLHTALEEIENETQIHVATKHSNLSTKSLSIGKDVMKIKDWLTLPQTYIVALIYMFTRLSINLGQVYVPFYIQDSLRIECTNVATIPLTMYISGFLISTILKLLNKHFGRQISYCIGAALTVAGAVLVLTLPWDGPNSYFLKSYAIYFVAILLGAGASAILVTSLSITADLIGKNIDSGAFVYGGMSFSDKVSCGLTILLINSFVPCPGSHGSKPCTAENVAFYRDVLGYSVGGSALLGVAGVILLTYRIHRQNWLKEQREANERRRELK